MDFKVKDKCYKILFLILIFSLGICKLSSWFVGRQSTGRTSVHTVCVQNELLTIQLVLCRYQKMVYSDYEKGTKKTPKLLSSIPEDYICSLCRCEDGQFDFLIEIERLREVGSLIKA